MSGSEVKMLTSEAMKRAKPLRIIKDFPETTIAEEVRFRIIEAAFLLAENSVVDKQQERYNEVVKRASRFLQRYPDSEFFNNVTTFNKKSERKNNFYKILKELK